MKALSVRQPFASAIAIGAKDKEYRTWRTHYRGDLLICSTARSMTTDGLVLPGGHALCIATLLDCIRGNKGQGYIWLLDNIREIIPISVKGKQGIYNVDCTPELLPSQYDDHIHYYEVVNGQKDKAIIGRDRKRSGKG